MDENPYKAPTNDGQTSGQKTPGLGRRVTVILAFPCFLIAGLSLFALGLAAGEIAAVPNMGASRMYMMLAAVFLISAATWGATGWALWTNRSRLAIAVILGSAIAIALGALF